MKISTALYYCRNCDEPSPDLTCGDCGAYIPSLITFPECSDNTCQDLHDH